MIHSIIDREGRVLLPIIIRVVIIPNIPIGTSPLRWSIIISNSLEILSKCYTWRFKFGVDYITNPIIARTTHIIIISIGKLLITKNAIARWALKIIP